MCGYWKKGEREREKERTQCREEKKRVGDTEPIKWKGYRYSLLVCVWTCGKKGCLSIVVKDGEGPSRERETHKSKRDSSRRKRVK